MQRSTSRLRRGALLIRGLRVVSLAGSRFCGAAL